MTHYYGQSIIRDDWLDFKISYSKQISLHYFLFRGTNVKIQQGGRKHGLYGKHKQKLKLEPNPGIIPAHYNVIMIAFDALQMRREADLLIFNAKNCILY